MLELELRLSLDQFLIELVDDVVLHLNLSLKVKDNVMSVFLYYNDDKVSHDNDIDNNKETTTMY